MQRVLLLLDEHGLLIAIVFILVHILLELLLVFLHALLLLLMQIDVLVQFGLDGINPVEALVGLIDAEDLEQEGHAQGETVVRDERMLVVSIPELVAAVHNMVDLASSDGRDQRVEVFERRHIFIVISEALIGRDHFAHEVIGVLALLLHQVDCCVKHLDGFKGLTSDGQVHCHVLKFEQVEKLWQVLKQVLVIFERRIFDHANETEGVADLRDALSNRFKIVFTFGKILQSRCKLKGPLVGVLALELLLVAVESLRLLQQHVLDCVIKQERFAEVGQLPAQELVHLAHNRIEDTNAVGTDRVEHLVDADCAHLFGLLGLLDEDLLMKIIAIVTHEDIGLLKEKHDIDTLIELLRWQMGRHDLDAELVHCQGPHELISAEIVGGQGSHPVEDGAQVLLDLVAHVDLLLKEEKVIHARVLGQVTNVLLDWVDLVKVRDHDHVDLLSKLLFSNTADGLCHVLCESLVDLFLVVVDSCLRVLQVPNVIQHVKRVAQGHQEVVHLVEAVPIRDDLLQQHREESSVPVEESAAG